MVRLKLWPQSESHPVESPEATSHHLGFSNRVVVLGEGTTILGRGELLGIFDPEIALREVEIRLSATSCTVNAVSATGRVTGVFLIKFRFTSSIS